MNTTRQPQAGVSLVESLVALLVLSVGLLGIAGLFVDSVKNSRTALLRTQAINLVSDMADRIRANSTARDAYQTATYGGAPATHQCAPDATAGGGNCTIAELAEDDLGRWIDAVGATLPGADQADSAVVEYAAPANPGQPEQYVITVRWLEPGATVTDDDTTDGRYRYRSTVVVMPRDPV